MRTILSSSSSSGMFGSSGMAAAAAPRMAVSWISIWSGVDVNSGEEIFVESLVRLTGFMDVLVRRLPSPGGRRGSSGELLGCLRFLDSDISMSSGSPSSSSSSEDI